MSLDGGKEWGEYFNYHHHCCATLSQLDWCNLGDKYLSDLAPCLFSVCCSLMEFLPSLSCITAGVIAEQESVFLSKNHVIALPSTCFSEERVCMCCVGHGAVRLHTLSHKAMPLTCVSSMRVMWNVPIVACRYFTHTRMAVSASALCSLMPIGASTPLGFEHCSSLLSATVGAQESFAVL